MTYWIILALFIYVTLLGIYIIYIDYTYISREIFDKIMEENYEKMEKNEDLIVGHINKINKQLGNKDIITR